MSISFTKFLGCASAVVLSTVAVTGTEISLNRPEDWTQKKLLTVSGKNLRIKGTRQIFSATAFKAMPGKTYRLLGTLKMVPGSVPAPIHYGILPLDQKKQPLFETTPQSETTLVADVNAGTKDILVANAAKWQTIKNRRICIGTGNTAAVHLIYPVKITQNGASWKITLSRPLPVKAVKGTKITLIQPVPALYFAVARSSAAGIKDPATTSKQVWHKDIKFFRVLILANWKAMPKGSPVPELEMSDLRLQIQ